MFWLNYHHLQYFWVVAREGGLVAASKVLHVSHPTLSAQIHALEDELGERLFVKSGRRLVLSEVGHVVFRYADEIFGLGRELVDAVQGKAAGRPLRLDVGIVDVVPKVVVRRLLQPAFALDVPTRVVCRENSYDKLLAELALHTLDILIADAPVPPGSNVRAFNHLLGETPITFFGSKELAKGRKAGFPKSLHGAPLLLPLENSTLRRSLNQWFARHQVEPHVVAEFEDSALLKEFGANGVGIFAAPSIVESEIVRQYGVVAIGRAEQVRESFYAVSIERRLKHPAVLAITDAARQELFA